MHTGKESALAGAFKVISPFFLDSPSEISKEYLLGMVYAERECMLLHIKHDFKISLTINAFLSGLAQ